MARWIAPGIAGGRFCNQNFKKRAICFSRPTFNQILTKREQDGSLNALHAHQPNFQMGSCKEVKLGIRLNSNPNQIIIFDSSADINF